MLFCIDANAIYVFVFVCRATTLSSAVSSLSNTGMSFTRVDEKEKQQALEEEQARLQALKVWTPAILRVNHLSLLFVCVCLFVCLNKLLFYARYNKIFIKGLAVMETD